MKELTAVEWLFLMLNNPNKDQKFANKLLQQAKEMEKEQIVEAVNKGWNYHEDGFVSWMGEQYYNETYGGNK
jgi:hypothetical protein